MRLKTSMLLCTGLLVGSAASADDVLGLYVGAGVGQSTLKQDYYQIDSHATGWKLIAGWRPLSFVGAEIEYANLGSKNVSYTLNGPIYEHISTDAHATAVFAVGYLPVPLPWIDLYGKVGAARVQNNTTARSQEDLVIVPTTTNTTTSVTDNTRTSIAWGAGLQFKLGMPAVRVEYERFAGEQGNDSLLTAALTLNF
jgi:Outer membrane protein beta-barrel domain